MPEARQRLRRRRDHPRVAGGMTLQRARVAQPASEIGAVPRPAAPPSGIAPEPNANREDTQVENLCYERPRGAARAREPALLASAAMDGEAKSASSERRPGRPQRASGDGHGQPRASRTSPREAHGPGRRGLSARVPYLRRRRSTMTAMPAPATRAMAEVGSGTMIWVQESPYASVVTGVAPTS